MRQFTYFGHSCFMIEIASKKLLFDPFITPNELAKNIDITSIRPDYIFISHGHEDHIADAVTIAKNSGAKCISNYEIFVWLQKNGVENGHPMNTGGQWAFDFGKVKCTEAVHSSSFPDGTYAGNPMGFVITSNDGDSFYYSGDTALTLNMQLTGEEFSLSFAVLPIGDNFTMGIEDAVKAAKLLKVKKVIGVHFDTFGFIKIDHHAALEKFKAAGLELLLPEIGKSYQI